MTGPGPIFANAMWRSGSTYLASRFAASDRYLLFYEPCHEGVGRKRSAKRTRDRGRDRDLRHPSVGGGYFDPYERIDPETRRPLTELYSPRASLRDVYGEAADATVAYLRACDRVARAEGKIAFFGFCRSGTQHARAFAEIGGTNLHLWRSPREQFASYNWPDNDYFVPGTLLQLMLSERYRGMARALAGRSLPLMALVELLPERKARWRYRLGRRMAAALTIDQCYALFYLSWRLSERSARPGAAFSFSLTGLEADVALRTRVEQAFGIDFAGLRPTPVAIRQGVDYDDTEAEVDRRIDALGLFPAPASAIRSM